MANKKKNDVSDVEAKAASEEGQGVENQKTISILQKEKDELLKQIELLEAERGELKKQLADKDEQLKKTTNNNQEKYVVIVKKKGVYADYVKDGVKLTNKEIEEIKTKYFTGTTLDNVGLLIPLEKYRKMVENSDISCYIEVIGVKPVNYPAAKDGWASCLRGL